jgi:hypothetical protein
MNAAARRRPSPAITAAATAAAAALATLPACGPTGLDHTPAGNILDADTESIEGGLGHWYMWFSTDLARTTDRPRRGLASMRVTVNKPYGWGVQLDNWPGFPAAPGDHHVDLAVRAAAGSALDLEVAIRWRNTAGDDLQTDVLRVRPDDAWQLIGRDLTAPAGTTRAAIELTGSEGDPGDAIDVDEIFLL